uniref:nucleoside recognition domain-containing protein n=1 Tax=Acetatifactor sp. TaxID=1872090 RepID=UPI004057899C
MKILYTLCFVLITGCILTHSDISLAYALIGLDLWFNKMVPALFPFMILSGVMIRMNLTPLFSKLLSPVLRPLYQVSENGCYAIIMGFLCGFPMGAKTISDLHKREMLSPKEAEFLLAFCNNIGPVYFCSFVLPLLNRQLVLPYLVGMYGIPLLYGMFLRRTVYKNIYSMNTDNHNTTYKSTEHLAPQICANENTPKKGLLNEVDDAITNSIQSILSLGGYMIFFNLLNIVPHIIFKQIPVFFAAFFEITGGLKLTDGKMPLYCLLWLPFGGLSCIAQTNSCIKGTTLSLSNYTIHKFILMILTGIYYLGWFLLSPSNFLR